MKPEQILRRGERRLRRETTFADLNGRRFYRLTNESGDTVTAEDLRRTDRRQTPRTASLVAPRLEEIVQTLQAAREVECGRLEARIRELEGEVERLREELARRPGIRLRVDWPAHRIEVEPIPADVLERLHAGDAAGAGEAA